VIDRRLHILILGVNYVPEVTGIAPYTTATAEHLASLGHEVTVLTGMPYYPQWRVAAEYRRRLWAEESINSVRVIRIRQYVPRRQTALRRAGYELSSLIAGCLGVAGGRSDVVLAIVPNLGSALAASFISIVRGIPYGIVVQDVMGNAAAQSGMRGGTKVAGATKALEGWVARRAGAVAIVAPGFGTYLGQAGVDPAAIHYIQNWCHVASPKGDRAAIRQQLNWRPDEFVLLHAGNMGLKQGLEAVVAAARLCAVENRRFKFVLMGGGSQL
jgi:colanic acid biosynthesis glycosyl transferase WcaI